MSKTRHKVIFLTTMILLTIALFSRPTFAQQTDAETAIASAKQQIVACNQAARDAEGAGANISSLSSVLNDAGDLLSRSELAYSQGDFGGAQSLASECSQRLSNFISESNALGYAATQQRTYDFWVNFIGSIVGTFVVIVAGFIVWRYIDKRYVPIEAKNEVQTNEST